MPDITMCTNDKCPLSWKCWRFKAPPNDYQSYQKFNWYKVNGNIQCIMFKEIPKQK